MDRLQTLLAKDDIIEFASGELILIHGGKFIEVMNLFRGKREIKGDIIIKGISLKNEYIKFQSKIGICVDIKDIMCITISIADYLQLIELLITEKVKDLTIWKEDLLRWFEFDGILQNRICDISLLELHKLRILLTFIGRPEIVLLDSSWLHIINKKKFCKFVESYIEKGNLIFITTEFADLLDETITERRILRW